MWNIDGCSPPPQALFAKLSSALQAALDGQQHLQRLFYEFGKTNSGTLTRQEFSFALSDAGVAEISALDLALLCDILDPDQNGITYDQLAKAMKGQRP